MKVVIAMLRANLGLQGLLSTAYMGELYMNGEEDIELKNCVLLYEVAEPTKTPDGRVLLDVKTNAVTNGLHTEGIIPLKRSDCLYVRDVAEGESMMKLYTDSIEAYRVHRAGLVKANQQPINMQRIK